MIVSSKPFKISQSIKIVSHFDSKLRFYPRGRDAFLAGLQFFVSPSQGGVLFPAFYCSETTFAVDSAGYSVQFLDTTMDLGWDLDLLDKTLSENRIAAVVFCDFFGWKARRLDEAISICRRYGVVVIRDCCHSAFTWSDKDPVSDITVFSFRKVLPVVRGGALLVSGELTNNYVIDTSLSFNKILDKIFQSLERKVFEISLINPYVIMDSIKFLRSIFRRDVKQPFIGNDQISPPQDLISWLGDLDVLKKLAESRIKNADYLSRHIISNEKVGLLHSGIENGDVPQTLPLMVSGANDLIRFLRERGVGAYAWPDVYLPNQVFKRSDLFPNSTIMHANIVCMPIHQDVTEAQLNFMAELLSKWSRLS
jgi:dTDP-4-amino-4,6-dideoxygalactose transaminase